jgi:peptidyl-tRNA hydrolase
MKKVISVRADLDKEAGSFVNRNVFIVYNGGMQRHREAAIMYIEWTETAAEKIASKVQGQEGYLQLKYDTDGCGCVVSGVTALWWVNEPEEK